MRTRTLGEIIQDTIGIYQKNLVPFIIVSVVGSFVVGVINAISAQMTGTGGMMGALGDLSNTSDPAAMERALRQMESAGSQAAGAFGITTALGIIASAVQTLNGGALTYAAGQAIQGNPVDPMASWTAVIGKVIVMMVAALVVGVLFFVGVLLVITIPVVVYVAVRWGFFAQAYLLEDRAPMASFSRSSELVAGQWWRVLGIFIVCAIVFGLISAVIIGILTAVLGFVPFIGIVAAATIGGALTGPLFPIAHTLLYYDLRARKEAPPASPMAPPAPAI